MNYRFLKLSLWIWIASARLICLDFACAAPPVNLLINGSFEVQEAGKPVSWEIRQWGGKTNSSLSDDSRHAGKLSLMLQSEKGADFSLVTKVPVEPFAVYSLSGWIKTRNVHAENGLGAAINIFNFDSAISPALTGDHDWTKFEVIFSTCGQDHLWVCCCLGGWGNVSGEAWYDDLKLHQIGHYDLDYSHLFRKNNSSAPHIAYYGGKTAIAEHEFVAAAPQLNAGKGRVYWRLLNGPAGMTVNAKTGESSWSNPTWGHHRVLIEAKISSGRDILDYSLIVVKNQMPDGRVVQTKYMDYVLPPEGVRWFEKWQPHALLNAQ